MDNRFSLSKSSKELCLIINDMINYVFTIVALQNYIKFDGLKELAFIYKYVWFKASLIDFCSDTIYIQYSKSVRS